MTSLKHTKSEFLPNEVHELTDAFEKACNNLRISSSEDCTRLARFIMKAAGELYTGGDLVSEATRLYRQPAPTSMLSLSNPTPPRKRGFATMSPERLREVASKGGKSLKPEQRSFFQHPEIARAAGQKGGRMTDPAKRTFTLDPALAVLAGRKGARQSRLKRLPTDSV